LSPLVCNGTRALLFLYHREQRKSFSQNYVCEASQQANLENIAFVQKYLHLNALPFQ